MKLDAADQQASSPSGSPTTQELNPPQSQPQPNAGDRLDNKRISDKQSSNNQPSDNQPGNKKPNNQLNRNRTKIISHQASEFPKLSDLLLTKKEEEVLMRCKRYPFLFFCE